MVSATERIYGTKPKGFEQSDPTSKRLFKKWSRSSREDQELFHNIMFGHVCSGKTNIYTTVLRKYLSEKMYEPSARINKLEIAESIVKIAPSTEAGVRVIVSHHAEPALEAEGTFKSGVKLTPETVEKAFGKGSWEVLNRGLVYLGDLRKAIS